MLHDQVKTRVFFCGAAAAEAVGGGEPDEGQDVLELVGSADGQEPGRRGSFLANEGILRFQEPRVQRVNNALPRGKPGKSLAPRRSFRVPLLEYEPARAQGEMEHGEGRK